MKFRFKKHGIQPENFLDFGGGYGVFTRWMRDEGYDFFHYDQQPQLMAHLRRRKARQSRA
jgi:2-polyprenyl-3-methyl-5-hydroxy-6-metoxy-1,4-benzoquinol methylase